MFQGGVGTLAPDRKQTEGGGPQRAQLAGPPVGSFGGIGLGKLTRAWMSGEGLAGQCLFQGPER